MGGGQAAPKAAACSRVGAVGVEALEDELVLAGLDDLHHLRAARSRRSQRSPAASQAK